MGTHVSQGFVEMQVRYAIDAIAAGDVKSFELALSSIPRKSINKPIDKNGRTITHIAALSSDPAFYACCEKFGCACGAKDTSGVTPAQVRSNAAAARKEWINADFSNPAVALECVKELASHIEKGQLYDAAAAALVMPKGVINAPVDEHGTTVMHKVCQVGSEPTITKVLLACGGSVGSRDIKGNTPLHVVASSTHANAKENAKILCDAATSADINAVNDAGNTALHQAVKQGNVGVSKSLLSPMTDVCAGDAKGENVFIAASKAWVSKDLEDFLGKAHSTISSGRNGKKGSVDYATAILTPDAEGATPLAHVASRGLQCSTRLFKDSIRIADKELGNSPLVQAALTGTDMRGNSLLHAACSSRSKETTSLAEEAIAEIYYRYGEAAFSELDAEGRAAVHVAAISANAEVFGEVIRSTPSDVLNATAGSDRQNIYHMLVEGGLRSKDRDQKLELIFRSGKDTDAINDPSPVTGNTPLMEAYKRGKKGTCDILLCSSKIDVDAPSSDGLTVVHHAAEKGDVKFLKKVLDRKNREVHTQYSRGNTPATYIIREHKGKVKAVEKVLDILLPEEPSVDVLAVEAARCGSKNLVKSFAKRGVDIKSEIDSPEGIRTGLVKEALRGQQPELAMYLAGKGVKINAGSESTLAVGFNSQCFNGRQGRSRLEYLVRKGAEVNVEPRSTVMSPLEAAITNPDARTGEPNIQAIKMLLSKGADINHCSAKGDTPLHTAAGMRDGKVVKLLISKGADPVRSNADGDTPLHIIARSGDIGLLQHYAKKCPESLLHANGRDSATVIHAAIESGKISEKDTLSILKTAKSVLSREDFKSLINTQKMDSGTTILHFAASKGYREACEYLLKQGADRSLVNSNGFTAGDVANIDLGKTSFIDRFLMRTSTLKRLYDGVPNISDRQSVYVPKDIRVTKAGTAFVGSPERAKSIALAVQGPQERFGVPESSAQLDEHLYASIDETYDEVGPAAHDIVYRFANQNNPLYGSQGKTIGLGGEGRTSDSSVHDPDMARSEGIFGGRVYGDDQKSSVRELASNLRSGITFAQREPSFSTFKGANSEQEPLYAEIPDQEPQSVGDGDRNVSKTTVRSEVKLSLGSVPDASASKTAGIGDPSQQFAEEQQEKRSSSESQSKPKPAKRIETIVDLSSTSAAASVQSEKSVADDSAVSEPVYARPSKGPKSAGKGGKVGSMGNEDVDATERISPDVAAELEEGQGATPGRLAQSVSSRNLGSITSRELSDRTDVYGESPEVPERNFDPKIYHSDASQMVEKLGAEGQNINGGSESHLSEASSTTTIDKVPESPSSQRGDDVSWGSDVASMGSEGVRSNFMSGLKGYLMSQKDKLRKVEQKPKVPGGSSLMIGLSNTIDKMRDALLERSKEMASRNRDMDDDEFSSWDEEEEQEFPPSGYSSISSSNSSINSSDDEDHGADKSDKKFAAAKEGGIDDSCVINPEAVGPNVSRLLNSRNNSSNMGASR